MPRSSFQVVVLLGDVHRVASSSVVLEAFHPAWGSWAGEPEVGVIVDRAKYFLADFSDHMTKSGCRFDSAAKAAPWHVAKVERHGGLWQGMFRRVVWSKQGAGKDDV